MFKIFIVWLCFLFTTPVLVHAEQFCGCILRMPASSGLRVSWKPVITNNLGGYQLKVVHYYYEGMEEEIIEVPADVTSYIIEDLPRTSRHFEIKLRSFKEFKEGEADIVGRVYSLEWVSSTDKTYAVQNGEPNGWVVYTYPDTPSWW